MNLTTLVAFIGELGVLLGVIIPLIIWVIKIANGQKCQLRSEMLQIYRHYHESRKINQYEYETFMSLYVAYKALGGNSFVDKICETVKTWDVDVDVDE